MKKRHSLILLIVLMAPVTTGLATITFLTRYYEDVMVRARIEQEQGIQTFWRLLDEKRGRGHFRVADGRLLAGDYVLSGNYELPDKIQGVFGGSATIFLGDVRVSTNVLNEDRTRAVGTRLVGPAHDALFTRGVSFRGEVPIFGSTYVTAYDPIADRNGNIIGAVFVGVKKSEFLHGYEDLKHDVVVGVVLVNLLVVALALVLLRERRIRDALLLESEHKYRTLFEGAADGIFLFGPDCVDCNGQALRLLGCSRAEVVGSPLSRLFPPRQPGGDPSEEAFTAHAVAAAATAQPVFFPWQFLRGDSTPVDTAVSLAAVTVRGTTLLQATVRDVTAHRKADLLLQESERRLQEQLVFFQTLIDTIPSPIFYKDRQGIYLGCNDAFENHVGRRRSEIIGKSVYDLAPAELAAVYEQKDEELFLATGLQVYDAVVRSSTGLVYDVVFKKATFAARDGSVGGLVGVILDVTEQKRIERLLAAEKEVMEMIVAGESLSDILLRIGTGVEALAPGALASILLVDADGTHLRTAAAPTLPEEYVRAIDGTRIGPRIGSCGTAAFTRRRVVSADISSDPLWEKYRRLPAMFDLRSCWSEPIVSRDGAALGTFAIYYREIRSPLPYELQLIERAGRLAGIAIERKRADEKLAELRHNQQAILDNIPDLVWMKDTDGRFLVVNRAFAGSSGQSPESLQGKTDLDIWPQDLALKYREDDRKVMEGGSYICTEELVDSPSGRKKWIETRKIPVLSAGGAVMGTAGIARDINDRRTAELALRESEERFQQLFIQNEDAILLLRLDNLEIIDANPAAEELFAYQTAELKALSPHLLIGKSDLEDLIQQRLSCDSVFQMDKARGLRSDGTEMPVSIRGKILKLRNDYVVYCAVRDITEKVRLEDEMKATRAKLIQTNRITSLGMLASSVAHEINNPNNYISVNAMMLAEVWRDAVPILESHFDGHGDFVVGGLPFSDMRQAAPRLFTAIIEGSKRIDGIIRNLRNFVVAEKAGIREPIDVNEVVASAAAILWHHIHTHTDNYNISGATDLLFAMGNPQQIEQVVINLIMNALQSLESKSAGVNVRTYADPRRETIVIEVRDEGRGMSREVQEKLTEPFFTTRMSDGGSGLGLYISDSIVREHQGSLEFESAEGRGTVARLHLPIAGCIIPTRAGVTVPEGMVDQRTPPAVHGNPS